MPSLRLSAGVASPSHSLPCPRIRSPGGLHDATRLGHSQSSSILARRSALQAAEQPPPPASSSSSQKEPSSSSTSSKEPKMVRTALGYTVSSMYIPKHQQPTFVQLDHEARRRERDVKEIVEASKKLGIAEEAVRSNIKALTQLLPDIYPDMNRMRASDWAKVVSDTNKVASVLIVLKSAFPAANVSSIISKLPRILLQSLDEVQGNAEKVKQLLASVDGEGEVDRIIEAVPSLSQPKELQQALSNLKSWFPAQDPIELLRSNPLILNNVGESSTEPDPSYGENVGSNW